ncbi:MAG: ABC transporter ATP-binding protein/permease [Chitinophagales bacterium]|nr:ABC transporter ATP-binding protein/permease [Chitinophagales bacterium]
MKHLSVLNKYFWRYKKLFFVGILCILISNYFRILSPQVTGFVVDEVQQKIAMSQNINTIHTKKGNYDASVMILINWFNSNNFSLGKVVLICSLLLLIIALLGGFFMFLMRQTIIVMSRHIEYAQKNEVFKKYLQLDMLFYKKNATGDLMNRISEDISRVRMYTGPAIMYFINLAAIISFSVFFMLKQNVQLTLYVLAPLPILAFVIYYVNDIINKKSEKIQSLLSDLTTSAQESYSGIRVIKSFVKEKANAVFFSQKSEEYKRNAISLAKVEAIYFPSMALIIGISTLLTIGIGSWYVIHKNNNVTAGTIAEFVIYINLLTFPVSSIGWTASIIQRAAASQKRLNDFLNIDSSIKDLPNSSLTNVNGDIIFSNVSFTYKNTGIEALKNFNLNIPKGNKILILGKTGSGKTTIAQLLLHFYNADKGNITIGGNDINLYTLKSLREQISYVPQDVFLFSDTIINNISFGLQKNATLEEVENAAKFASVHKDIIQFKKGYSTVIGERGVTLSGGQKQRLSIARALIKQPEIIVFDDCLSAVDTKTEHEIINNLDYFLQNKTAIIITHRIFTSIPFDKIIVMSNGSIAEEGTHEELLANNAYYAQLYRKQLLENTEEQN